VIWGDHWALFHLANVASGIKSATETYKDCADLLDHSKPLCARTRYARLRAGSPAWWKRQIETAGTELDRMFVCLIILRWGSSGTLAEVSEPVGALLQSLTVERWNQLAASLKQALSMAREPRDEGFISLPLASLPQRLTARCATALGIRTRRPDRYQIYMKYLADYRGGDLVVLDFCQREGVDLSHLDPHRWEINLELIKRGYAQGVISEPFAFQQVLRRSGDPQALPLDVAEEVATNANRYPGYLVGLAELKCRVAAAAAIVPVGQVAVRDRWFEPDAPRH
jgi:hypothetical protein